MMITVLTVCRNAAATLPRALDSLFAQTECDYESVVVDGASTDGTAEILKAYETKFPAGRFLWSSEPDGGIYDAMNKGIRRAHGDFVLTLNADDLLEEGALKGLAEAAILHPEAEVIYARVRRVAPDGTSRFLERRAENLPFVTLEHPGCLIRRSAFGKYGFYDSSLKIAADYDLLLRFYLAGARFAAAPETFVAATFFETGVSSRRLKATEREVLFVRRRHRVMGLIPYALRRLQNALRRDGCL